MGDAAVDKISAPAEATGEEKPTVIPAEDEVETEPKTAETDEKEKEQSGAAERKEEAEKGEEHQERTEASTANGNEAAAMSGDHNLEAEVSSSTMPLPQHDSQAMEDEDPSLAALRGKANTPASVFLDAPDARELRTGPSRYYQWEWHMTMRTSGARTQEDFCPTNADLSARGTASTKMVSTEPLTGVRDPPPGFGAPRVFYIHQRRPRPLTPLKVWRGYHGNVYFEPMKINQASLMEQQMEVHLPPMSRCSEKLQSVISQTRWNPEHVLRYRQNRHMLTPVAQVVPPSVRYKNRSHPALIMDREALGRDPESQHVLRTLESTGTLRVQTSAEISGGGGGGGGGGGEPGSPRQPVSPGGKARGGGGRHDKTKVCRGSVARKLVMFRSLMVPLMQEQLAKNAQVAVAPAAVEAAPRDAEAAIKLPSIASNSPDRPRVKAK